MITQQQLNDIGRSQQEDNDKIMKELANECLCPIPLKKWIRISGFKKSQRTAYNLYKKGILKGVKLGNVLLYTNWQYDEEIKKKYFKW